MSMMTKVIRRTTFNTDPMRRSGSSGWSSHQTAENTHGIVKWVGVVNEFWDGKEFVRCYHRQGEGDVVLQGALNLQIIASIKFRVQILFYVLKSNLSSAVQSCLYITSFLLSYEVLKYSHIVLCFKEDLSLFCRRITSSTPHNYKFSDRIWITKSTSLSFQGSLLLISHPDFQRSAIFSILEISVT